LQLWQKAFPPQIQLDEIINISELSRTYELSGSDIMNIVQHCCLQALQRGDNTIHPENLSSAIKREFSKAGKII
jgi:ATP-dependent 26S proteasome regulatory subunit